MSAEERRTLRQQHARPLLADLKSWIDETLSTLPQKQKLAEAMRYSLSRWAALSVYIDDGRVEIDNNMLNEPCVRLESDEEIGSSPGQTKAVSASPIS